MNQYGQLDKFRLVDLAVKCGINEPQMIPTEVLRERVICAHRIQQVYEGFTPNLSKESEVYDINHPWELAVNRHIEWPLVHRANNG